MIGRTKAARARVMLLLAVVACGREPGAQLGRDDVARLRWIEGDWRGVGAAGTEQAPFFERYSFPDDTTLLVETFEDSTWADVSRTQRYTLAHGRFGNAGAGERWVATHVDSVSAEFAPVARTSTYFRWVREPGTGSRPEAWGASIWWDDASGTRQRRNYLMTRVSDAIPGTPTDTAQGTADTIPRRGAP